MTGSTAGIGRAIAVEFAARRRGGRRDRTRPERGAAVVAAIAGAGGHAAFVAGRPRRRSARAPTSSPPRPKRLGGLTVLVNNAAGGGAPRRRGRRPRRPTRGRRSCASTSPRRCGCARAAIPHMRARRCTARSSTSRPGRPSARARARRVHRGQGRAERADAIDRRRLRRGTASAATRSAPGTCSTTGATPTCRRGRDRADEGMHLTRLGEAPTSRSPPCTSPAASRSSSPAVNLQLDGGSSIARGRTLGMRTDAPARVRQRHLDVPTPAWTTTSRSGPSTGIDHGRGVGREARSARLGRRHAARRRRGRLRAPRRQPHRPRPVPSRATPTAGPSSRNGSSAPIDTADAVGAECLVFTTGPVRRRSRGRRRPTRSSAALAPVLPAVAATRACRSRSSTRTRCGSTSASSTRCATRSTSPAGSTPACAWRSTRAGPNATSTDTIADGVDRLRLVQVSDFTVGTLATPQPTRTRRRRHPDRGASSAPSLDGRLPGRRSTSS